MKFTNKTTDARIVYGALVEPGGQTPDLTPEQANGLASQDIWEAVTTKTAPAAPVTEEK